MRNDSRRRGGGGEDINSGGRERGKEGEREKMLLLDWVRGSATLTEHVQKSQVYKSLV